MAEHNDKYEVRRSLWDRLIDTESGSGVQEAVLPTQRGIPYLQESIQQNLEQLLNSHIFFSLWAPALNELDASLINYGLPDYTGTNMGADVDREHLRRSMERAIRAFEPRLEKVQVKLLEPPDEFHYKVHLRIDAEIASLDDPAPVTFRSDLDPLVRRIAVATSNR